MTLREKLNAIYDKVEFIPKKGYNKLQNYKFMRAADVTNTLRKQLVEFKVYAEVNYTLEGAPYTIARASSPNAPMSALNVRCAIVFHDLESTETLTASGIGSGCDTSDKAAYKAMTGALKYALKNAFLVPDEEDPEADESVGDNSQPQDRNELPDFQESKHAEAKPAAPRAARPTKAQAAAPAKVSTKTQAAPSTAPAGVPPANKPSESSITSNTSKNSESPATPTSSPVSAPSSETTAREPGDESEADPRLPTEPELAEYRKLFQKLGDDLSTTAGGLKSSPRLPIEIKLKAFLLNITGADSPRVITNAQWKAFFARVDAGKNNESVGLKGITVLVNRVSGIEPKEKK
jgi:ERF superfamily